MFRRAWTVSNGAKAPVVARAADSWEPPKFAEAVILADRILQRESGDLLLDSGKRHALAGEIEQVLSRIRDAYPVVADIAVRQTHVPGALLIGMKPGLSEIVSHAIDDATGPVALYTGHAVFDALNAQLGLSAVKLFTPHFSSGTFYFNEHLNIGEAIRTYSKLEGIEFAEPDFFLVDGADVDASKSQGSWQVVVRNAWGDCPSGCIYEELFFFTVKGADIEQIERAQAMEMVEFVEIVENRGWDWHREVPPDARRN